jgi:hypothetical protein
MLQKWTRLVARQLLHELGRRIAPERPATGQQLVEHNAQAEDIATAVDPMPFATGLLGRNVGGSSRVLRSLDRHEPVQLLILGQIDQAEAPSSQDLHDPVSTNPLQLLSGRNSSLRDGVPVAIQRDIEGI